MSWNRWGKNIKYIDYNSVEFRQTTCGSMSSSIQEGVLQPHTFLDPDPPTPPKPRIPYHTCGCVVNLPHTWSQNPPCTVWRSRPRCIYHTPVDRTEHITTIPMTLVPHSPLWWRVTHLPSNSVKIHWFFFLVNKMCLSLLSTWTGPPGRDSFGTNKLTNKSSIYRPMKLEQEGEWQRVYFHSTQHWLTSISTTIISVKSGRRV